MEYWSVLTAALLLGAAILAIILQWLRAFYRWPLQASIRALVGLVALLVSSLAIPTVEGNADLSLDWGWLLNIKSSTVTISTGAPIIAQAFAWLSITALLSICLVRVPPKPAETE